jgi:hypothetical protein
VSGPQHGVPRSDAGSLAFSQMPGFWCNLGVRASLRRSTRRRSRTTGGEHEDDRAAGHDQRGRVSHPRSGHGAEFADGLRGPLLRPGDGGYDEARKVWNGMIDRHPALIARCVGVADVINSVNFARAHRLLVAVRGGGYNR